MKISHASIAEISDNVSEKHLQCRNLNVHSFST